MKNGENVFGTARGNYFSETKPMSPVNENGLLYHKIFFNSSFLKVQKHFFLVFLVILIKFPMFLVMFRKFQQ